MALVVVELCLSEVSQSFSKKKSQTPLKTLLDLIVPHQIYQDTMQVLGGLNLRVIFLAQFDRHDP